MTKQLDAELGINPIVNVNPLESPSHVFSAAEAALDDGMVHISLAETGTEASKRPQLSEGEVLGGLALLSIFGSEKIRRARAALALQRRLDAKKALSVQDIIEA